MATDQLIARDAVIRQAAFDHVRGLQSWDLVLSHDDIRRRFVFEGERWPLWNPQRGIFKPREMPFLLSIRTVFPRKGGRVWYDDQRHCISRFTPARKSSITPSWVKIRKPRKTCGSERRPSTRSR
jgi:hypothetical protein